MVYVVYKSGRKVYVDRNSINQINKHGIIQEIVFDDDFKKASKFCRSFENSYLPIYGMTKKIHNDMWSMKTKCDENHNKEIIKALRKALK